MRYIRRFASRSLPAFALTLSLALSLISLPQTVLAWGALGHQTVGSVADQLIAGSNAEKQVRKLLGSTVPLKTAAVWADCAKGVVRKEDGSWHYEPARHYDECKPFETPSRIAAMEDYARRNAEHCGGSSSDEACRHKSFHYTDVSNLRDHYDKAYIGTSDHDVVSAIQACILVLQGKAAPAPFDIKTKKEALLLLSHFVGDIHQPLHVTAVYLDKEGHVVDPDAGAFDPATATRGGNSIEDGSTGLHSEWDSIDSVLSNTLQSPTGATEARAVPKTRGAPLNWPTAWASDSVRSGHAAFAQLTFGPQGTDEHWSATHPKTYAKERRTLQHTQLVKGGARLAQLLTALWP